MTASPSGTDSGATKDVNPQVPARTTGQPERVSPGKTGTNLDPVKGN